MVVSGAARDQITDIICSLSNQPANFTPARACTCFSSHRKLRAQLWSKRYLVALVPPACKPARKAWTGLGVLLEGVRKERRAHGVERVLWDQHALLSFSARIATAAALLGSTSSTDASPVAPHPDPPILAASPSSHLPLPRFPRLLIFQALEEPLNRSRHLGRALPAHEPEVQRKHHARAEQGVRPLQLPALPVPRRRRPGEIIVVIVVKEATAVLRCSATSTPGSSGATTATGTSGCRCGTTVDPGEHAGEQRARAREKVRGVVGLRGCRGGVNGIGWGGASQPTEKALS